jgi:hypothetical protein
VARVRVRVRVKVRHTIDDVAVARNKAIMSVLCTLLYSALSDPPDRSFMSNRFI